MKRFVTLMSFCCFLTAHVNAQYCIPYSQFCDETIDNVTLNTINHNSGTCGTVNQGYSDFTSVSTDLNKEGTYTLSVTLGPSYMGDVVDVWLDYNQDGVFESNELIDSLTGYQYVSPETETSVFTVPANALTGNTRLRLRLRFAANPTPCDTLYFGVAEDYTVNILPAVPCAGTPATPVIITPAITTLNCIGTPVTLVDGDPNHTSGIIHQWQSSPHSYGPWTNISGANSLVYNTEVSLDSMFYRVIDTCSASGQYTVPSNVYAVYGNSYGITTQPVNTTVCAGGSTTIGLSVSSSNSDVPTYYWYVDEHDGSGTLNLFNNSQYSGVYTNTLTITGAAAAMNGYSYSCLVITGACSFTYSDTVNLTVDSGVVTTTQPLAQTSCPGDNVSFAVNATGDSLTYQWQVNDGTGYVNINDNVIYSGAATATLHVAVVSNMNGYLYRCVVSGTCTSTTSDGASLSTTFSVPSISASGSTSLCSGQHVVLSVPSGNIYQWYNGINPILGATGNTYTTATAGNYYVHVSATGGCSGNTAPVAVSVNSSPNQPNIFALGNTTFCLGSGVLLESDVTSGLPVQWLLDNGMIVGSTATSYNATDSGSYSIQVTGTDGCTATSLPIQTTVYELPVPVISTAGDFNMCVTGGSYSSYQWFLNGVAIPGATGSCYMATGNGSYSVAGYDDLGCSKMSFPTVLSNVGVPNLASIQQSIKVYPNPATDVVHVDAPVKVNIAISSLDGRVVYYEHGVSAMDISKLASGVYMLTVYDEQNIVLKIEKLVKE